MSEGAFRNFKVIVGNSFGNFVLWLNNVVYVLIVDPVAFSH